MEHKEEHKNARIRAGWTWEGLGKTVVVSLVVSIAVHYSMIMIGIGG